MAARLFPHRVPTHADAFVSSHFPGPAVPFHHRAGPQSLHRNCGKIHYDSGDVAFKQAPVVPVTGHTPVEHVPIV